MISPYSIATVNPDIGLREDVPLTYNEKIETEALKKADQIV